MAWIEEYQTEKGIRYRVGWRENGRIRRRKAGPLRKTAIDIRNEIEDQQAKGFFHDQTLVNARLDEYLSVCQKTKKERTFEIAKSALNEFEDKFGAYPLSEITQSNLEQFKYSLINSRKINGVNIIIRNIKTFFKYCQSNGYLNENPALGIKQFKPQKVARFLSRDEIAKLYKASSPKIRRAIFCLLYTGMRIGELLNLKQVDLTPEGLIIHETKTGRSRAIALSPRVRRIVQSVINLSFTRYVLEEGFRYAVRKLNKTSNFGRLRLHDLRHTWASAYLKNGGTLADLQRNGGWASLSMLQVYVHFQKVYLDERMARVRF